MIPILKKNAAQKTCVDFFEKIKFPISDDDILKWYLLF
jgi:hypothetical protein